jgi:predicted GIY-YIG superfamily endonuclease
MFYTCVRSCGDGDLYVGSTVDLQQRIKQHRAGEVTATAPRSPSKLEHYEARHFELNARRREKKLKTSFGRILEASLGDAVQHQFRNNAQIGSRCFRQRASLLALLAAHQRTRA